MLCYPLSLVLLLHVGSLLTEVRKTKTETVRERGARGRINTSVVQKIETSEESNLTCDLYVTTGTTEVERLRIEPRNMTYESLGERRQVGSGGTLKLLIEDLQATIPGLLTTNGVRMFLAGQTLPGLRLKDFLGAAEGLLQLKRATGWQREIASPI